MITSQRTQVWSYEFIELILEISQGLVLSLPHDCPQNRNTYWKVTETETPASFILNHLRSVTYSASWRRFILEVRAAENVSLQVGYLLNFTFILPCILINFFLNNQPDALIIPILLCYKTPHVSGIFSVHN